MTEGTRPRAVLATDLALSLALAALATRTRLRGRQGQAMDDLEIFVGDAPSSPTSRASACPRQARRTTKTNNGTHAPRRPAPFPARSPQPQGAGCANQKARVRYSLQSKATRTTLPPRLATGVGYGARSSGESRRWGEAEFTGQVAWTGGGRVQSFCFC
jgi:hypothetical protein